jgi:hypothetical protein
LAVAFDELATGVGRVDDRHQAAAGITRLGAPLQIVAGAPQARPVK